VVPRENIKSSRGVWQQEVWRRRDGRLTREREEGLKAARGVRAVVEKEGGWTLVGKGGKAELLGVTGHSNSGAGVVENIPFVGVSTRSMLGTASDKGLQRLQGRVALKSRVAVDVGAGGTLLLHGHCSPNQNEIASSDLGSRCQVWCYHHLATGPRTCRRLARETSVPERRTFVGQSHVGGRVGRSQLGELRVQRT
jgi:hypothetical protein